MDKTDRARPSLRDFDAYTDRNGQDLGQDSPLDVGVPQRTQADMAHDPMGQARDARVAAIEHQFFYGDAVLVSPVTEENATIVSAYFPDDWLYAFDTWQ